MKLTLGVQRYYAKELAAGEAYLWVRPVVLVGALALDYQPHTAAWRSGARFGAAPTQLKQVVLHQVGYDSRPGKPCFVPHSSFRDPSAGPNPPPRRVLSSGACICRAAGFLQHLAKHAACGSTLSRGLCVQGERGVQVR